MPVCVFVTVTVAPGIVAPEGSETVPTIVPKYCCAWSNTGPDIRAKRTTMLPHNLHRFDTSAFIFSPPHCVSSNRKVETRDLALLFPFPLTPAVLLCGRG